VFVSVVLVTNLIQDPIDIFFNFLLELEPDYHDQYRAWMITFYVVGILKAFFDIGVFSLVCKEILGFINLFKPQKSTKVGVSLLCLLCYLAFLFGFVIRDLLTPLNHLIQLFSPESILIWAKNTYKKLDVINNTANLFSIYISGFISLSIIDYFGKINQLSQNRQNSASVSITEDITRLSSNNTSINATSAK